MACCTNVGPADRAVRALLGLAALIVAFTALDVLSGSLAGAAAALFGVVMLATAALGLCPPLPPLQGLHLPRQTPVKPHKPPPSLRGSVAPYSGFTIVFARTRMLIISTMSEKAIAK
jgi:hypothetical protein